MFIVYLTIPGRIAEHLSASTSQQEDDECAHAKETSRTTIGQE